MFEKLADAVVVDAMASAAREEAAGCARRLAAIGELYARRAPEDDTDRQNWAIDGHANVVAEVSAALNISRGRAAGQRAHVRRLRPPGPVVLVADDGLALDDATPIRYLERVVAVHPHRKAADDLDDD